MTWIAIIGMILQIVGPYLIEWLKKWLEKRLHRAASRLPEIDSIVDAEIATPGFRDNLVARFRRLMQEATDHAGGPGRRAILRLITRVLTRHLQRYDITDLVSIPGLSPDDAADLSDLSDMANNSDLFTAGMAELSAGGGDGGSDGGGGGGD